MTYSVAGQTFEHRDLLKSMGGRWDNANRRWIFDRLSSTQVTTLRGLVGVSVHEPAPISDEPAPRRSDDIVKQDRIAEIVRRLLSDDDDTPSPTRNGPTGMYGDDERYFNYFKDQNPTAFFGFSSLGAFVDYIETLQRPSDGNRDDAWQTNMPDWRGTPSLRSAIRLTRDGWSEGLEGLTDLDIPHAERKRRYRAVAGGTVNVGRMLSGDPAHMVRRTKQPGRKVVTLFVETFMSAGIDPDNAIIRARLVASIADHMERQGYTCEIVAVLTTLGRMGGAVGHQAAITLKTAGERLNLLDVIFALGHPSFFRRLCFAVVGCADECRTTWQNQGYPTAAFNSSHPTGPNEYYIKQLSLGDQSKVTSDPLSMLPLIKPEGLEL